MQAMEARPLLGVAGRWGAAEIELAHRFDDLHQLVYRRGGLRSSNAALEEVTKLILVRLWALRTNAPQPVTATEYRAAFRAALAEPSLLARDPAGNSHPIWPPDEPFRLADLASEQVLATAAAIVADTVRADGLGVADPLGTAFDALLAGRYDHTGGLGTYLTPSSVARMMAETALGLLRADPAGDAPGFGDPYCGTGRFLVALLSALGETGSVGQRLRAAGPFGADQSAAAVAKARINLLLYGVERPLVWCVRDSVTDPWLSRFAGRVPLILTNPPFGDGQYDDPEGVADTVADLPQLAGRRRIDPSLAGLARALRLLAPGGVLGIVLPDGIIAGDAFAELAFGRGRLDVHVAASVSLPTATFALSGTVAKTSAVFLRRQVPVPRVALARVEHVGYVRQAGKAAPDPAGDELAGLPPLLTLALRLPPLAPPATVSQSPAVSSVPAAAVDSLDPARLDPDALAARQELLAAGGMELRTLLHALPARRAKKISSPYVSVLHIDDLGTVDWVAAHTHTPTTLGVLAPPGSLIVSLLNPSRLRAAVMPEGEDRQVSSEFGVFECDVDPYAVLALLYSPLVRAQLRPLGTGTSSSRRRIGVEDILSLIVPGATAAQLADLGRVVRASVGQVDAGRAQLHEQYLALAASAPGASR